MTRYLFAALILSGCGGSLGEKPAPMIPLAYAEKLVTQAADSAAAARQARDDNVRIGNDVNQNLIHLRQSLEAIDGYINGRCDERDDPRPPGAQ